MRVRGDYVRACVQLRKEGVCNLVSTRPQKKEIQTRVQRRREQKRAGDMARIDVMSGRDGFLPLVVA